MECPGGIESSDGSSFLSQFRDKAMVQRIPLAGTMDLTHRCNLRCVHCYVSSSQNELVLAEGEMNTQQAFGIIDQLADAGCISFMLTGGEPLLRKDFSEIYSYAKKKGMFVTVFTNGTLITSDILDLFKDLPPKLVEVSLYGATEDTYEKITGVKGSFGRCMEGIELLLDSSVPVGLKTMLMKPNVHEFIEMEEMANGYGVDFRFDSCIFARLDGDQSPLSLRISPEEAVEKDFAGEDRVRKWKEYFARIGETPPSEKLYGCGAGVTGFHVDPYGNLQPCLMTSWIKYDLLKGDFAEGWKMVSDVIAEEKAPAELKCRDCGKKNFCGYCPAFARFETGSEYNHSEYLCSIGHMRFDRIMGKSEGG